MDKRVKIANDGGVMIEMKAKFQIGEVVKHRLFPFRGVIFDVDPTFNNTEEWWLSIPAEVRPRKDQPFYHLLAENEQLRKSAVSTVKEVHFQPPKKTISEWKCVWIREIK